MYYLLVCSTLEKRFSLYQITSDKYICLGRKTFSRGQCNFSDITHMHSLHFPVEDLTESPEAIALLLSREHYRFDSYPDVANLYLTHPEIFL